MKQLSIELDRSRDGVVPLFLTRRPSWNLQHGWWKSERQCRSYAKQIREFWKHNEKAVCGPDDKSCSTLVHTELMQEPKKSGSHDARRHQLPILSFLATQHSSVKLNILANEQDYTNPPEWLAYLLRHPVYGERLQITSFDFETLENLPEKRLLSKAYHNVETWPNKSDLRRYAVLYHFGGIWIDSDNLILNDLRPLFGFDFVYASGSRLNGAVLGVSGPQSLFMRAAIDHATTTFETKRYPKSYYRFADDLFKDLDKKHKKLFLKLSGCLFESSWGGKYQNAPSEAELWSQPTKPENEEFFLDPTGIFTYHWHGHWSFRITPKSFGSVAHSNYVRELQLDRSIFQPAEEHNWSRPTEIQSRRSQLSQELY
eukprot:CAMPEP_0113622220 /NCGR_PEP_ID=MMETSP0017_2-20120614/11377_1 /TAXON_ID=2856 /ORGANISM="Cylindrotheca closterium" /LENGTH=370 /DNA_ID=CAMNT_0000532027 /DNA_START=231 /DNA_END=1343 /DNA_ORIENTATION=- /assembly_acc=CAM_ASM_000147